MNKEIEQLKKDIEIMEANIRQGEEFIRQGFDAEGLCNITRTMLKDTKLKLARLEGGTDNGNQ